MDPKAEREITRLQERNHCASATSAPEPEPLNPNFPLEGVSERRFLDRTAQPSKNWPESTLRQGETPKIPAR